MSSLTNNCSIVLCRSVRDEDLQLVDRAIIAKHLRLFENASAGWKSAIGKDFWKLFLLLQKLRYLLLLLKWPNKENMGVGVVAETHDPAPAFLTFGALVKGELFLTWLAAWYHVVACEYTVAIVCNMNIVTWDRNASFK